MTGPVPLRVLPVDNRPRRRDWLDVPAIVHQGDPAFVAQLRLMESMRISQQHNPFFTFGEAGLFVALRGDRPVGRISAQINHRHRQFHAAASGHFGFFDCRDDFDAAKALVDAAACWLRARGADHMEGPYSFSVNEECGLLIEGFDTPPAMLMNHARPHAAALLDRLGFDKAMDTFAYRMTRLDTPLRIATFADPLRADPRIRIRPLDTSRFEAEVHTVIDIFNDAWSGNWGFVPFSEAEIVAMARELKPFYRGEYGRIVEIDGEPAALMLAVPDINGLIKPFGGRLLPFNWARLAFGLWRQTARSARIPLMGIRKRHQNSLAAVGVLALLVSDFLVEARKHRLDWVEFSWVLESNKPMNALARMTAGDPVKRYRLYRRAL
ncbi:MAG: dATP pyrophosphohydrolase [Hyphomicrobiaceae bacterium]|nr:dATP pyrophosphohydrolase [Hyphomicrobiaceae bacterium]